MGLKYNQQLIVVMGLKYKQELIVVMGLKYIQELIVVMGLKYKQEFIVVMGLKYNQELIVVMELKYNQELIVVMGLIYNLFNNTTQLLEEKVQTINHQSSPPFITFLHFVSPNGKQRYAQFESSFDCSLYYMSRNKKVKYRLWSIS